jgi:hypothetical protein
MQTVQFPGTASGGLPYILAAGRPIAVKADRASEEMRRSTERLVKRLKEDLERWDSRNEKAKAS